MKIFQVIKQFNCDNKKKTTKAHKLQSNMKQMNQIIISFKTQGLNNNLPF